MFIIFFLAGHVSPATPTPGSTPAVPHPAGVNTVAGDSTRMGEDWQERVRRAETREIRREKPKRDSLNTRVWTLKETVLRERQRQELSRVTATGQSSLLLRANLLRWATLTPDISAEWRVIPRWGVLLGGAWTSWTWDSGSRRYALWELSAEARYYIGTARRWHAGAAVRGGKFNRKLGTTGRQGSFLGGAATGGYRLPLSRRLSLDFSAGAGYTRSKYDKYTRVNGVRVREGERTKGRWGVNSAEVSLEFKI